MPNVIEQCLNIKCRIAKRHLGLRRAALERFGEVLACGHDPHTAPTAAMNGFDHEVGLWVLRLKIERFGEGRRAFGAWNKGHTARCGHGFSAGFIAEGR